MLCDKGVQEGLGKEGAGQPHAASEVKESSGGGSVEFAIRGSEEGVPSRRSDKCQV